MNYYDYDRLDSKPNRGFRSSCTHEYKAIKKGWLHENIISSKSNPTYSTFIDTKCLDIAALLADEKLSVSHSKLYYNVISRCERFELTTKRMLKTKMPAVFRLLKKIKKNVLMKPRDR